jgi:hypothetical protein
VLKRFERFLRMRLNKLGVSGIVAREGRGGAHRNFTYKLTRRLDIAAKALREKGSLAPAPMVTHQQALAPRERQRSFVRLPLATGKPVVAAMFWG